MSLFEVEEEENEFAPDDKIRLFETHKKTTKSVGSYVKLILLVALGVIAVGGVIFYFSLPGVGDKVKAPAGLENQVRLHFLEREKRTMTDATFFNCNGYYWITVEVEKRPDIAGKPNNTVSKYHAKAIEQSDGTWQITATPVVSEEDDRPCS